MEDGETGEAEVPPVNQDPAFFSSGLQSVTEFLQTYGWFILLAIIALVYIKNKLSPSIQKLQEKMERDKENRNYDPDKAQMRNEQLEMARQHLQEQYSAQAERHAEQQKIKEEEKRKQKIQEWDNFQDGKGYRSKYKPKEEEGGATSDGKLKSKKPKLRPTDYNPLMGDSGGGVCFRPPRRGGGGGGG